jgi:dethiobiotin synthetase
MSVRGLFVTGTDTGVGKTVVTRALVRALVNRGLHVVALKPVGEGPTDAEALAKAAGRGHRVGEICRYQLKSPVSPHLAARRDGVEIEKEAILALVRYWIRRADLVIAEGAGGLLVPLSDNLNFADLVQAASLGLVIVAPNVLGTINATLLTVEAARRRGIPIAGVVLDRTPSGDLGNAEAIARHGEVPVLGELPTVDRDDDETLAKIAGETLDLDRLLRACR